MFPIYEFLKVAGLQFGCDSSKIIKFDCFWRFLVVKRQLGNVVCAIYVGLMETNRLIPWLRGGPGSDFFWNLNFEIRVGGDG